MSPRSTWHDAVYVGLHYDLHANADDTELGAELTAEHLRERLLQVRPDWIQCDCKGHPGYTSWPTTIGSTSPGVVVDALRIHRDVTHELGIKLGMHYSGVWDTRAIEVHPEWARIDEYGTADKDITCRLSGYDDELMIPQMLELIDGYDVDGFWVDGENWASRPCWCPRCRAEWSRRTGYADVPETKEAPNWDNWLAFHRDLFVEHVTHYTNAIHARKPDCTVCSNWMYSARQPDPVQAPIDYLSGDYDSAFGADRAAIEGRVLDARGMSWDLMAWAFTKTGDMRGNPPWVMKPAVHLQQELAEVLALGGAVMVYNSPQRSGWLTSWHQELLAEAAAFCRLRQEICWQSRTVPQAAVLHLASQYYRSNDPLYNYGTALQPVEGALHALLEAHYPTDVLTEDAALERLHMYKLIVVPEQANLSTPLVAALEAYAAAGGHVILSGAHLAHEVPTLVGATAVGAAIHTPTYLAVGNRAVALSAPWQAVAPGTHTSVWHYRLDNQEIAKDATSEGVVSQRQIGTGSVVAIHGPIFRDYMLGHYPLVRELIARLVQRLEIAWMVELTAPARVELVVRQKDDKLLVHLINRGAGETLSAHRVIVEELVPVENIQVRIRRESRPNKVVQEPEATPLAWSYTAGYVNVHVPTLAIHSVIVIA